MLVRTAMPSNVYPRSILSKTINQRTNGPVNAHLIWTAVLVGELMAPALGCGLNGPQEHRWQDLERGLLNIATIEI